LTDDSKNKVFIIANTLFDFESRDCRKCSRSIGCWECEDRRKASKEIIKNWLKVVRDTDIIWHLGNVLSDDVSYETIERVSKLPGIKFLILGTRDREHDREFWKRLRFHEVYDGEIEYGSKVILSTSPVNKFILKDRINIHGETKTHEGLSFGRYKYVGAEILEFKPVLSVDLMIGGVGTNIDRKDVGFREAGIEAKVVLTK